MASSTATGVKPLGTPPPGVKFNYINPFTLGPPLIGVNAALLVVVSVMASMRLLAIVRYKRPFWWDDGMFL